MGIGKKPDFPPILGPGRHKMTVQQLKALCCDGFPTDARRQTLFQKFEEFIQEYLVSSIVCELWINGSFLTKKENPSDVDVTAIIEPDIFAALSPSQTALITRTGDGHYGPDVDAFAWPRLPLGHPDYDDELLHPALTWHEQYAIENSGEWLKGFAVIELRKRNV